MGETLTTWTPSCNGSVRVELSGHRTTSDSGALLLREALDSSGVIEALEDNLVDPRHPLRIRHSLASQIRTLVLQRAMGWIDLSDTDTLRRDPLWQLACSDARGMTPLVQDRPSQATLSRLLTCLGHNDNIDAVHEGLLRLVAWRLTSLKNGERPKQLTLDIDGLPIEVHGHQGGSAYHGLYGTRIYSPLVASLAETGDMVGGLLREGNAGPAENADTWIPHLVKRLNESTGAQVRGRIDAGFTDNDTLEALEKRSIEYLGRLRSHKGLQALAAPYLAAGHLSSLGSGATTLNTRPVPGQRHDAWCWWFRNAPMTCCCMPSSWSPTSASSTGRPRRSWHSIASAAAPKRTWAR